MDLNCSNQCVKSDLCLKQQCLILFYYQGWVTKISFLKQGVLLGKKEKIKLFISFSDILSPQFAEMISALDLKCLNPNALK